MTGKSIALPGGLDWFRLGTRYVEGVRESENGPPLIDNLASGKVRPVGEETLVDLDRPGAPDDHIICAKLRRRVRNLEGRDGIGHSFSYANGVFVGEFGNHGMVQIDRCAGRSVILKGQFVGGGFLAINHGPHDFNLRAGLGSWDTGGGPDASEYMGAHESSFRPTLSTYTLATGARHRWTLPRIRVGSPTEPPPGAWGYSTHTAHMVFWVATLWDECDEGGCVAGAAAVYGARL
jgi:hypothetical protein